jgi:site-specific recombinase XerD
VLSTIDEAIRLYELSNEAEGKSPSAIRWYADMLAACSRFIQERFGDGDLSRFTTDTIRNYILCQRQRHRFSTHPNTPTQSSLVSPTTIQGHVRALKAFSTFLFKEGRTDTNRLAKLKIPKAPRKLFEPLTPEEIATVSASIDTLAPVGKRNCTIFYTILDTGLRAGGITSLTVGALNLDDGFLRAMEKGSKERIVPFGNFVQSALTDYLNTTRPSLAGGKSVDQLFLSQHGQPMTVNALKLIFSRLATASGITRLHSHLCRHTFAINYLMNGGDVFSLKEILGHSSLEMVNRYLAFTSAQIRARHREFSSIDRMRASGLTVEPSEARDADQFPHAGR